MSGLRAALAAALWPDDGGGGGEGERRGGGGKEGGTGRRLHVVVESHVAKARVIGHEVGKGWLIAIVLCDLNLRG